ncbi:MAG: acyl-CoA thioester hydrolase/BAAT C-terminal domain-containing protein [Bacteroidota bacterium]
MNNRKVLIPIGIIALLMVGYLIIDSMLFDGVRSRAINESGFQGTYYAPESTDGKTTVILLGGGQWGDYWAQYFAQNDMVGFSLPYIGRPGLPELPEEIALEYFENALHWLAMQPEVDQNGIVVMGASRNAELALVVASTFPNLVSGVVAYAPSAVSWSNTVLPYNSNELKASWTVKGMDIPYIPMDKIKGGESNTLDMLGYWESGLAKKEEAEGARIEVERINGPILLFSGKDDQIWPSVKMADMIEQRLTEKGFRYSVQNLQYDQSGHAISGNPDDASSYPVLTMNIDGKDYEYEQGGTAEGDFQAKQDARGKLMEFLGNL